MLHSQVLKKSLSALILTSSSAFCANYTLSGSALFWQPHEDGLDYVIKNQAGTAFANQNARVERVDFDWDWGFRVEGEYELPCCPVTLTAFWTRFDGEGNDSATAPLNGTLFQVWTIPGSGLTGATNASAHWSSCLNSIDVQASVLFNTCCCIDLSPYIGVNATWIDQNFRIESSGGTNTQIANAIVLSDTIKMKNDFWGVGPKVGLKTDWDLFCGVSLYCDFALAILYGQFDLKQSETVELTGLNTPITYLDIDHNKFYQARVNLDINIGLAYEMSCFNDCFGFFLKAGWENLYFFGQNQLMRFSNATFPGINTSNRGDLSYQGLTLKAGVSF